MTPCLYQPWVHTCSMLGPDSAPSVDPKTDSLPNERCHAILSLFQCCIEADCWRLGLPSNKAWGLTSDSLNMTCSESCSRGVYDPHQQLIAITKQRGKLLHRMGEQSWLKLRMFVHQCVSDLICMLAITATSLQVSKRELPFSCGLKRQCMSCIQ